MDKSSCPVARDIYATEQPMWEPEVLDGKLHFLGINLECLAYILPKTLACPTRTPEFVLLPPWGITQALCTCYAPRKPHCKPVEYGPCRARSRLFRMSISCCLLFWTLLGNVINITTFRSQNSKSYFICLTMTYFDLMTKLRKEGI